jgi:hypothetical protein
MRQEEHSQLAAFNAALVSFACVLISLSAGFTSPALPGLQDISGQPLQTAIDALRHLDNGNRMVDKCVAFLGRLVQLLSSLSKS